MNTKYYFYLLECSDGNKYYGYTNNLIDRLNDHSKGQVHSTKNRRPIQLAYYKEFNSKTEAFKYERSFKNGKTRKETINKLIDLFPKTKCQGFNSHSDLCSLSFHKSCAH